MIKHYVVVADLPDQVGTMFGSSRAILLCRGRCRGEFSAHRGDYWAASPETVLRCCGRPMALVVKRCVYEVVR